MMQLYLGDFVEKIQHIPNKSVDLLLTDPPYLRHVGGCKSKWNVGVMAKDNKTIAEMTDFGKDKIYNFLNLVRPKMKVMNAFIFCSKQQLPYYLDWALEHKVKFDVLIWDKMYRGVLNYGFFSTKYEYVVRLYEKQLNHIEDPSLYQKVLQGKVPSTKLHPTQKPLSLVEYLVKTYSNEGDIILDSCMGSGTMGVAAKRLQRDFIGIELDETYYNIAKNRIENENSSN